MVLSKEWTGSASLTAPALADTMLPSAGVGTQRRGTGAHGGAGGEEEDGGAGGQWGAQGRDARGRCEARGAAPNLRPAEPERSGHEGEAEPVRCGGAGGCGSGGCGSGGCSPVTAPSPPQAVAPAPEPGRCRRWAPVQQGSTHTTGRPALAVVAE